MSQFSGKPVATVDQLAVDHNTAAHARTQSNHDEVLHPLGYSVSHLTDSRSIGIVCQNHGNPQSFTEFLRKRDDSFPRQVGCQFDIAGIIVTVRRTDSHPLDVLDAANLFYHRSQSGTGTVHIDIQIVLSFRPDRR